MIAINGTQTHARGFQQSDCYLSRRQIDSFSLTQSASRYHSYILNPAWFIEEMQPATTFLRMFNSIDFHLSFQHDVTTKRFPGKLDRLALYSYAARDVYWVRPTTPQALRAPLYDIDAR